INAAATLGGRPVGSVRLSTADPRERHRGVSHHTLTAYGRVALATADLVLPAGCDPDYVQQLTPLTDRHRIVMVNPDGLDAALRPPPLTLSTGGRGRDEEHDYSRAAAGAGRHAAKLAAWREDS